MRICVLTDAPCIFNSGFSQRVLREMDLISSNYICELYYYTFFSLRKYKELKKTPSLSNERNIKSAVRKVMDSHNIKEIETHFIISSRLRRILPDGLYDKFYADKVLEYVKKNHINILLCENLWCSYIGYLVSRKTSIKYIVDYHGVVPEEHKFFNGEKEDWQYVFLKQIEKDTMLSANHIICVSNKFKEYLINNFGIQPCGIDVVPCCVSEVKSYSYERNNKLKMQLGLCGRKVIIYAGSITKYQCLQEMALLFSKLINKDSSFYFLFLSSYSDYNVFDKLMKDYNVPENFYMLKSVPQEEVHNFLCMADYALIIREDHLLNQVASPTKIAEYLMAGLPIIGTNGIGDIADIPSAKILFDFRELKRDINNVVDEILAFDKSSIDREANSQVARAYVQNNLTWSAYKELYADVLSSLSNFL